MDNQTPEPSVPENGTPVSRDDILELNFVPQWARQEPAQSQYDFEERPERGRRGPRRDNRGSRDQRGGGDRRGSRDRGRQGAPRDGDRYRGERRPPEARPQRVHHPHRLDVTFLPERHSLGLLVRKIKTSQRAFPLARLAGLCLGKPEFYLVRIESQAPSRDEDAYPLYQCKETEAVFLDRGSWEQYALGSLLESSYEKIEEQGDPPSGQYVCVAKCGLSGELLGPPNYHGYNERIREIWKTRYPHLRFEAYCARIQTLRDEEAVESWKQQASHRTVYRPRDAGEDSPSLTWDEARTQFLAEQSDRMVKELKRVIVPPVLVQKHGDPYLRQCVGEAWNRENRFPGSMLRSLRPAFRHMGLHSFKIHGNQTFITHTVPHPVDPSHTVPAIRAALDFLQAQPGCSRMDLLEALHPGADPASPEAADTLQPLGWLVEKGHVIEFFDGTLALPVQR